MDETITKDHTNGDTAESEDLPKDAPMNKVDADEVQEDVTEAIIKEDVKKEDPTADETTDAMDTGENKDEAAKDEELEENEVEVANDETTDQPTESGKKKRKKSDQGDEATTVKAKESAAVTKRSSRERKSIEIFNPESYDKPDKIIHVIEGRGTALKSLPPCVESIEHASTDDIALAHKFIYGSRFKVVKKDMMQQLLDFSGYLPKIDSSASKKELEEIDDEMESKNGAKAYKLTIPAVKKLCDFFMIDRFATPSKDGLVEKLLDFLGAPHKSKLKGSSSTSTATAVSAKGKKSKTSNTKKRAKTEKKKNEEENDDEEVEDDDDEEDEEEQGDVEANADDDYDDVDDDKLKNDANGDGKELPSNETLRKWVRAYVRCFNENKLTVNHALVIGSEKFGIDLMPKKTDLKKLLIEEL